MTAPDPWFPRPERRRPALIPWAFLLILLVFGGLAARHFLAAPQAPPPPGEAPRQLRTVTLYFGSTDGLALVAEGRDLADCLEEQACLNATVQALIDGPVGDLVPVLPPRTVLHGVSVAGSEARVDCDRALIEGHPGGSASELLTVQALATTLAVNFPPLRQLQLLVDGQPVATLKGHVDLRRPVTPDFTLIRAAGSPPPAAPPPASVR